jgi:membrane peptidoglycan carboxypeptidase
VAYRADKPVNIVFGLDTVDAVNRGLWGVVNEAGTGTSARVAGFDVSGKTGTAQVVALDKTRGAFKDHAWFVAFAPLEKPEIAVVVLVENVGFGGTHSAPIAQAIFQTYHDKHYGAHEEQQIAGQEEGSEPVEPRLVDAGEITQAAAAVETLDESQHHPAHVQVEKAREGETIVKPSSRPQQPSRQDVKVEEDPASPSGPVKHRPKLVNQKDRPKEPGGARP